MHQVFVSIGSNIERERHIRIALQGLAEWFGQLLVSPVYESEAVGFNGENFFNLVAGFDTNWELEQLAQRLRAMEHANGRPVKVEKFAPRTLDIDILTFDDRVGSFHGVQLPRPEIINNAFVLQPLQDIAPDTLHPALGLSYRDLWQAFDQSSQRLWPITLKSVEG